MSFEALGLAPQILRAVSEQGYSEPTPVQARAIPAVIQGRDVKASAQTGTGKTAAFTLPLLHRMAPFANPSTSPAMHPVRALILTPTRELAIQVEESVQAYGKYLPLRSLAVYGGVNIDTQIKPLRNGVEILVATPGRLLDHVQQRTLQLGTANFLVLDEADRMLDMGFLPDIRRILSLLPAQRQNLLFSATFPDEIQKLCDLLLRNPEVIEVARRNTAAETVRQVVHPVDKARKKDLLVHLVRSHDMRQVLVFCATRLGCGRLASQLARDGIPAAAIHGDKSQQQRLEALEGFKNGSIQVLVATDIAARGIDIDQLPHVINYELPQTPEDYVHRIGRTGRAGAEGDAISLVSDEETRYLTEIERLLKRNLDKAAVPGFEPGSRPTATAARGERRRDETSRPPRRERGGDVCQAPPPAEDDDSEHLPRLPRFDREAAESHGGRPTRRDQLNAFLFAVRTEQARELPPPTAEELERQRRNTPALFLPPAAKQ